jgi:hypothetical protein
MAIDQTEKRRALARELMNHIDQLMSGIYGARNIVDEITSTGVTFVATDFEDSTDMKHITTTNIGNVQSNVPTFLAEMVTENIDDVFNLLRP